MKPSSLAKRFAKVLLPAPEGPSMAMIKRRPLYRADYPPSLILMQTNFLQQCKKTRERYIDAPGVVDRDRAITDQAGDGK